MGSEYRKDFKYDSVKANRIAFINNKIWFDHDKNPHRIEDAMTQVHRFVRAMSKIERPTTKAKMAQYWEDDSNRGFFYSRPIQNLIVPILVNRKYAFAEYKTYTQADIVDRIVTKNSDNCTTVEFSINGNSALSEYARNSGGMIIAEFFNLRVISGPDVTDLHRPVKYQMMFTRPEGYVDMVTTNISRFREEEKAREDAKAKKVIAPVIVDAVAVNDPGVAVGVVNIASLTRRAVKAVNKTVQEYIDRLKMEETAAAAAELDANAKWVEARRVAEQARLRHEEIKESIKSFQETIVASIKP